VSVGDSDNLSVLDSTFGPKSTRNIPESAVINVTRCNVVILALLDDVTGVNSNVVTY
jgi:hypothetical protein